MIPPVFSLVIAKMHDRLEEDHQKLNKNRGK